MLYLLFFIFTSILFIIIPFNKINIKIIKIKKYIFPITIVIFLILLVSFSESSFKSAHTGFMLWANNVLPALLPFFICIELIKATNFMEGLGKLLEPIIKPIFKVPGCGVFAIVMGMSSGYPVGAKIVSDLRENNCCTKTEGERLLAFTNTSGPLFIIGSVGIGMFGDSKIGLLLLLTHFIASILVGILFRFYNAENEEIIHNNYVSKNKKAFKISMLGELMSNAIKNSIATLLLICGYMIFFSVLTNILSNTNISFYLSKTIEYFFNILGFSREMSLPIINGIMEVTGGISELSLLKNIDYIELLPCVAFVLGFGGISVCMQVNSIIANTDLSIKPYILGKLLQAIISSMLTFLMIKFTNFLDIEALEVMSYTSSTVIESSNILLNSITSLILICIFINQLLKIIKNKKDIV
ncbi:MAG: sporulation integral membrane protein YlbJ [Clostridia bacterium]|nr:sporulation integral membrane protein YlbJ [Clostridia bacterium]